MKSTTVSWAQLIFTFYYSHIGSHWTKLFRSLKKARSYKDESEALRMRVISATAARVCVWAAGPTGHKYRG